MKHLVFFTLSMTRGGAEGVIARLCNDYLKNKYRVTIVTCMNRPVEQTLSDDISVIPLDFENAVYSNLGQRFLIRRNRLKKVLHQLQPDLAVSFLPEPNFLLLSLKGCFSFPMIFSVRNDPKKEYHNPVYQALMRYFYPKADGAVFQTEEARDYFSFAKKLVSRSVVIANPIGIDFMNLTPSSDRKKEIVSVGRLDSQKNHGMMLRAFAKLAKDYPEYTVKIYGGGSMESAIREEIHSLGLENRVVLCGNVPDLKDKIGDSAMFVLASDYEGIPNSLMEALALGIPSVATDCPCGGCRFLIENEKNGLLIPVRDEKALEQAMRTVLSNSDMAERMAQSAVEDIKKIYPEKIYEQWDEYLGRYF